MPQSHVSAPSCTGPGGHGGVVERGEVNQITILNNLKRKSTFMYCAGFVSADLILDTFLPNMNLPLNSLVYAINYLVSLSS